MKHLYVINAFKWSFTQSKYKWLIENNVSQFIWILFLFNIVYFFVTAYKQPLT